MAAFDFPGSMFAANRPRDPPGESGRGEAGRPGDGGRAPGDCGRPERPEDGRLVAGDLSRAEVAAGEGAGRGVNGCGWKRTPMVNCFLPPNERAEAEPVTWR